MSKEQLFRALETSEHYVPDFVKKFDASDFPIRRRVGTGNSTPEDYKQWKHLAQKYNLTGWDIAELTNWSRETVYKHSGGFLGKLEEGRIEERRMARQKRIYEQNWHSLYRTIDLSFGYIEKLLSYQLTQKESRKSLRKIKADIQQIRKKLAELKK